MKKSILTLAFTAITATAIGLCASSASASTSSEGAVVATTTHCHTHAASQGKYCSGSVGCDCTGFSPITGGKEWQKSYCKKCGHRKSCH